ncbi:outer membrane protein OmpA-like peptidoglycan-associated protein/DNA-binding SARP family transcriptional activator [Lipingzhangella halophila]|uniref:Outer membrane protein OmpA-like peptidoglycan-associated protein/DNA-binding SARP family transcriptional activator n=1 Tax=Lipingzhangella halophila TaxID=1783352 RepID=A0A7W7RLX7_9ACTN|nr:OmpA family protein [Lipingzhangella halophila]MBB4934401.1 outer membrane protein OmpA-like peptidoglycan-associated protein/DNA-binding SARP family transcriptional activator [Lipingzhangella halophila]
MGNPRAAIAALATLAFILAAPLVLLSLGWPLAQADVSSSYLWASLRSATVPPPVLAAAVIAVAWAAWAVFTALVALDVVALLRGRLPRLSPLRLLAITTLGGGLASTASAAPTEAPPTAPPVAEAPISHEHIHTAAGPTDTSTDPAPVERTRVLSGFSLDSSEITPTMRESLDDTRAIIETYGAAETIEITGHTDTSGTPERNRALSHKRAETVAQYLQNHLPTADITARGVADEHPRTDSDDLGAPAERRVEITYTLAPPQPPTADTPPQQAPTQETPPSTSDDESDSEPSAPQQDTAAGENGIDPLSGLAALTAAGGAGVGAGWWLGRRRAPTPTPPPSTAPDTPASDEAAVTTTGETTTGDAPHTDAGVIDSQARVLLATQQGEPVRVAADEGLAITGTYTSSVIAALTVAALHGHTSVLTTHEVATHLGLDDHSWHPRLTLASDTTDAVIRAEALMVAAARQRLENEHDVPAAPTNWTLLIVGSPSAQLSERLAMLAQRGPESGIIVVIAGAWPRARPITCERLDTLEIDLGPDAGAQRLVGLHVNALTPTQVAEELVAHARSVDGEEERANPTTATEDSEPAEDDHAPPDTACEPASTAHSPATPRCDPAPASSENARVHLRLFAPNLEIEVDGRALTTGLRTRGRHLLALVALRPDGVSSEDVSHLLSPDADTEHAKNLRNTAISALRAVIRDMLDDPQAKVVIHTAGRYYLDSDLVTADVLAFDEELSRARATQPPQRHDHLAAAVRLHHSPLLAELTEPWVEPERQNRSRAVADACVELAHAATAPTDALNWLERARTVDEYNEVIYQEIMRLQRQQNRPDAARRTYEQLVTRLTVIDAEPSITTTQLLAELTAVEPPEKKPIPLKPRHSSPR